MWPFKTYRIEYIRGTYYRTTGTIYISAINMARAIKKLQRQEWPSKVQIENIQAIEEF